MPQENQQPRLRISKLRNIGWSLWDPIGLLGQNGLCEGHWTDRHNSGFADEYDNYLVSAALQLKRGAPSKDVVDYLVQIESDYMGLDECRTTRPRAEAVVAAILADRSIWI